MEPISDKDLDKLVQQRFEDFEAEPSANLWSKISKDIDEPVIQKKSGSVYRMSAASILIFLSAALYFYKPAEVIKLHGKTASPEFTASNPNPGKEFMEIESFPVDVAKVEVVKAGANKSAIHKTEIYKPILNIKETPDSKRPKVAEILVAETQGKIKNEKSVITEPINSKQINLAAETPIEPAAEMEANIPKRRIKSVGGLVNFVIAQVDKREDKLIEFKDGNEGSEISGINLGLIKFKSRNK